MNQPNPAFKAILDKLPPALHPSVLPVLEEWDKGVQERFEEIRKEYEPYAAYKPFIDNNIQADYAWQSVVFADEMQRDPKKVVSQIHEAFKDQLADLVVMPKSEFDQAVAAASESSSNDDLFGDDANVDKVDFTKIPEFAQMQQTLQQMQQAAEEERRKAAEEAETEEFEAELDELEEKYKDQPFNRTIVTAFMTAGLDGDAAVKQLHILLGQDAEIDDNANNDGKTTDAPVTMGNGGNVGSGSEDGSIDWAKMSNSDFNENVAKVLEAQLGPNS